MTKDSRMAIRNVYDRYFGDFYGYMAYCLVPADLDNALHVSVHKNKTVFTDMPIFWRKPVNRTKYKVPCADLSSRNRSGTKCLI